MINLRYIALNKLITLLLFQYFLFSQQLPEKFVYVEEYIPNITVEMRYYSNNNFIGTPIDGYHKAKLILSYDATLALQKVQKALNEKGLGLKVFDGYRPQRAVDHFVRWGQDINDIKMKEYYYPNIDKSNLFKEGYIATRSGHSRGSTVDVTIIELKTKVELDMGSAFDYFGDNSWINYPNITQKQKANRNLLSTFMKEYGFKPLQQEWWHFTLIDEPFKDHYFDFIIQ